MLLGNVNYLVQKMSSTVVSSLMTGVPIIADSQVLASYTFLKPEHVFLIGSQETEMDVMQRVSGVKTATVTRASSTTAARLLAVEACATCLQQDHADSHRQLPDAVHLLLLPQVVRMSPAEVFAVRQNVLDLQQLLNRRAFAVLQAFMPLVEDIPAAPAVS